MNLKTTLIVVSVGVPIVNSILVEVRNRWFSDKRSNAYRRITKAIISIWFLLIPIGMLVAYLQIAPPAKEPKEPKWRIVVNGLQFTSIGCELYIPSTNAVQTVTIAALNIGNATALGVTVRLYLPAIETNFLEVGKGWAGVKSIEAMGSLTGRVVESKFQVQYTASMNAPIPSPLGGFFCPEITVKRKADKPFNVGFNILAYSGEGEKAPAVCLIHFIPGVGDPSIVDMAKPVIEIDDAGRMRAEPSPTLKPAPFL